MRTKKDVLKKGLSRATIFRIAIAISLALVAVSIFVREPGDQVFAASGELAAAYRGGVVEVNIPYDEHMASSGAIDVQIVDPADKSLGSVSRSVSATRVVDSWRVSIPISGNVPIEDLAWDRLTISAGGVSKTISLSEILLTPVIKFFGQTSYAAGSTAAVRVVTVQDKSGTPLRDSRLKIDLVNGKQVNTVFTGRTDALGTAQIGFQIPAGDFGGRQIHITADTPLGHVEALEGIKIDRSDRILLTTDKPLYQPGQTMHVRALALDGPTRAAAGNQPVTLEIEDGKGNKVFKKRGVTDAFGISSAEFELADEVNFGPYHVRAILGDGEAQSTQEKTVTVDRYVLPKFKLEVNLDGDSARQTSYYRPGEKVSGKVAAHYLFGKPIAGAEVTVKLKTFDVQEVEIGSINGKTDNDGNFHFDSKLPDFLAGRSTEQGSATVSIEADVKDTAQHSESKSRNVLVSNANILIMGVPESGSLLSGLDNRVYILTSYPDGTPAQTEIKGNITPAVLKTDSSGVAVVSVHSDGSPVTLELTATDAHGRAAMTSVKLDAKAAPQSLMLRANKAVYHTGEPLRLETFSTRQKGAVYIDITKGGQTLLTRAVETSGGRGRLDLNLTPDMFGAIEARAYQITADAEPIVDRRLIYVDPADDLKVDVNADRQSYKPGDDASISFHVTDANGRPVSAALGVEIVDEAVFALSDRQPGFEKVFMYLEKELLTPRIEVHQFTFDKVVRPDQAPEPDFPDDPMAKAASRERAAQVLFAAAGTASDNQLHGEFGREALESKRDQFAQVYMAKVYNTAQTLAGKMADYYERHRPSAEGFDADLKAFASASDEGKLVRDPWGNHLHGEGKIGDDSYSYLTLRSAGPDGRQGTADDIVVNVVANRNGAPPPMREFRGAISVNNNAAPGGRSVVEGIVKDEDGQAISGAKVTVRRASTGRSRSVYTDASGRFRAPDLAPDWYEVSFAAPAYASTQTRSIKLHSGDRGVIDAELAPRGPQRIALSVYNQFRVRKGLAMREMPMDALGGVPAGVADGPMMKAEARPMAMRLAQPESRAKNATVRGVLDDEKDKAGFGEDAAEGGPRVRSFFPETLYANPALITDGQGRATIHVPVADSITTWRITSLASTQRGLLGSSTSPIKVFQDFFVDLDLPASITEGDVISVPAAVYNYLPSAQQVSLELRQDPWFALEDDQAVKQIDVQPGEVSVAYFRLKASKIGDQQLQVTARLLHGPAGQPGDAVARQVTVAPNGEEKSVVFNERLEGAATRDVVIPDSAIPDASKILVKLYPGALSQVVDGLDSMLRMPSGCFEQTSSSTYPDILVMDYMRTSKKITPEIRAKAEGFISLGYQRLVTFEVPGGGFSWFGQAPANKILTAFGLMEFSDMSRVHEVDPRLIERTQNWLASQQQPDGGFKPDTSFINEGATTHYNTDVLRITAYIGWSLAATGYKGPAVERAKQYCQARATGKEDAYTLAVLANFAADSGDKAWTQSAIDTLAAKAIEDQKTAYWKQEGETPTYARQGSADLEATALAAQALLKSGLRSGLAKKTLDYLTQRKDSLGNWSTTQATILALKAFLLSFTKGANTDTAGSVAVSIDGKEVKRVEVTKENNDLLQVVDLGPYTHAGAQAVSLKFQGKGSMQYQIVGRYYLPWTIRPAREPLSIKVDYDRTSLAQNEVATASVQVRNNTPATAKMIMVDLGIPPGFEPSSEDFESMVEASRGKNGGKLEKYTLTARQVILYFDGLSPNQQIEFKYKLRAKFPLRAQTFSSRVYEYYNPEVESKAIPVELSVHAK
ncbi:MAG TPA: MG2 domain-containing protein [Blastocatellia bacterium]|nr:MG2 domain-containing protein [Blastocatellia bacterium]